MGNNEAPSAIESYSALTLLLQSSCLTIGPSSAGPLLLKGTTGQYIIYNLLSVTVRCKIVHKCYIDIQHIILMEA